MVWWWQKDDSTGDTAIEFLLWCNTGMMYEVQKNTRVPNPVICVHWFSQLDKLGLHHLRLWYSRLRWRRSPMKPMLCGARVGGTSTRAPSLGLVEGSSLKLERGEQPGTLQIFLLLQHTGGRGWMLDSHSLRPMKSRCSREPSNLRIPGGVWRVETGERIPKKNDM